MAGAAVLADEQFIIANIGLAALPPVVAEITLITLGPGGSRAAHTITSFIAAFMLRSLLVTVALYADILIVQLGRHITVEAQPAVLAVLSSGIVLAADTSHHIQEVDETAAAGVAVAFAIAESGT